MIAIKQDHGRAGLYAVRQARAGCATPWRCIPVVRLCSEYFEKDEEAGLRFIFFKILKSSAGLSCDAGRVTARLAGKCFWYLSFAALDRPMAQDGPAARQRGATPNRKRRIFDASAAGGRAALFLAMGMGGII
ncbi:hypothetical protein [Leisingera sp. F5]|uniref:hypothetical protein n=1 Tax=Leisingera sp. F5 TaxID=1813816 RepID=UPI0025BBA6CF|nr:hypothetical protein [Leisingera sp. F5]